MEGAKCSPKRTAPLEEISTQAYNVLEGLSATVERMERAAHETVGFCIKEPRKDEVTIQPSAIADRLRTTLENISRCNARMREALDAVFG